MKNANKQAIKFFKDLLKKNDEDFFKIMDQTPSSDLGPLLERSGMDLQLKKSIIKTKRKK